MKRGCYIAWEIFSHSIFHLQREKSFDEMAIITTEPYVLLFNFLYTAHISTVPQLVLQKVCNAKYNNATICDGLDRPEFKQEQDSVQEASSIWVLILLLATLLPSLFTVLIWGPIADRIGRKRAILVPPIFFGLQCIAYFLNSTTFYNSHVVYLVTGAIATSVFGDFQGAYAIAYSYMADITERNSERTMRMAIMEGIMFFSGAPAGLGAGFLLQKLGFGAVFISTLIISVLMFLYVAFLLPTPKPAPRNQKDSVSSMEDTTSVRDNGKSSEGNSTEEEKPLFCRGINQNKDQMKRIKYLMNPLNHLIQVVKVVRQSTSKVLVISLLVCFWLTLIAIAGELYITVLFVKNRPFNLSSEEVGYYFAFISVARGVGTVVLSQIAVRYCGLGDFLMITIGLVSQIANYILLGLSTSKTMLYLVSISGVGLGVATSGLRSLITKNVSLDSHGSILAAIEFFDVFGALLANIMSNTIYHKTVATFPGIAFFVLGSFSGTALCIICCARCYYKKRIVNSDST